MVADLTINNATLYQVMDVSIACDLFSKTGARVGSSEKIVYDFVQPHRGLSIKNLSFGIASSDFTSCRCEVVDFKMADIGGPRD